MAVTKINYRYNPETGRDMPGEPETSYSGQVLCHGHGHHHVCSDNAMIDSGSYTWFEIWDGVQVQRHEVYTGRGGVGVEVVDDASEGAKTKALAYREAIRTVIGILNAFSDYVKEAKALQVVRSGCKVEVFKGRKVPKGTYYVRYRGEGDYGPYVNLSTTPKPELGNKVYNYVNPDNCQVVEADVPTPPYSQTVFDLANAAMGNPHGYPSVPMDLGALAPLHDALLEEGCDDEASDIRPYINGGTVLQIA